MCRKVECEYVLMKKLNWVHFYLAFESDYYVKWHAQNYYTKFGIQTTFSKKYFCIKNLNFKTQEKVRV